MKIRSVILFGFVIGGAIAAAAGIGDLTAGTTEERLSAIEYFAEKGAEKGLSEEELNALIELADDDTPEICTASRDAILENTNLELVETWSERFATRGNAYGSFMCYANVYVINDYKYENTSDAEVKDILKVDRDKAKTNAKAAFEKIKNDSKKELARPIYNNL